MTVCNTVTQTISQSENGIDLEIAKSVVDMANRNLVFLAAGLTIAFMIYLYRREDHLGFRARAIQTVIWPVAAGIVLWAISEWIKPSSPFFQRFVWERRVADLILDAIICSLFFYGGVSLLRLETRVNSRLGKPEPIQRRLDRIRWMMSHRIAVPSMVLLSLVITAVSAYGLTVCNPEGHPQSSSRLDGARGDELTTVLFFLGLSTLGFGIYSELSRERLDKVGAVCGLSVIVYGILTLPLAGEFLFFEEVWFGQVVVGLGIAYVVLKGLFFVGLISFGEMINQMNHTRRLERLRSRYAHDRSIQSLLKITDDLHDHVKSKISAIVHYTAMTRDLLDEQELAEARRELDKLGKTSEEIFRIIERMCNEREPVQLHVSLEEALQSRLDRLEEQDGIRSDLSYELEGDPPDAYLEGIYGVAIEALNNVEKHADASRVWVELNESTQRTTPVNGRAGFARTLSMSIRDDGVGVADFPELKTDPEAFRTMRARAQRMFGSLIVQQRDMGGTEVLLEVELDEL